MGFVGRGFKGLVVVAVLYVCKAVWDTHMKNYRHTYPSHQPNETNTDVRHVDLQPPQRHGPADEDAVVEGAVHEGVEEHAGRADAPRVGGVAEGLIIFFWVCVCLFVCLFVCFFWGGVD